MANIPPNSTILVITEGGYPNGATKIPTKTNSQGFPLGNEIPHDIHDFVHIICNTLKTLLGHLVGYIHLMI